MGRLGDKLLDKMQDKALDYAERKKIEKFGEGPIERPKKERKKGEIYISYEIPDIKGIYKPGDEISGKIKIENMKKKEAEFKTIEIQLNETYSEKETKKLHIKGLESKLWVPEGGTIKAWEIDSGLVLQSGETKEYDFNITLPQITPKFGKNIKDWFCSLEFLEKTGLTKSLGAAKEEAIFALPIQGTSRHFMRMMSLSGIYPKLEISEPGAEEEEDEAPSDDSDLFPTFAASHQPPQAQAPPVGDSDEFPTFAASNQPPQAQAPPIGDSDLFPAFTQAPPKAQQAQHAQQPSIVDTGTMSYEKYTEEELITLGWQWDEETKESEIEAITKPRSVEPKKVEIEEVIKPIPAEPKKLPLPVIEKKEEIEAITQPSPVVTNGIELEETEKPTSMETKAVEFEEKEKPAPSEATQKFSESAITLMKTRQFLLQEKIMAFRDTLSVKSKDKEVLGYFVKKIMTIGDTYRLKDLEQNDILTVHQKVLALRATYRFYWGSEVDEEKLIGSIKQKLIAIKPSYWFEDPQENRIFTAKGNLFKYEFEIEKDGKEIAEISKKLFKIKDTYGISINEDVDDKTAMIIIGFCIMLQSQEEQEEKKNQSGSKQGFKSGFSLKF